MKSRFWKVTWLIGLLWTLSIGYVHAATVSGKSGGTSWSFDSETGCLTIAPLGTSNGEYANGVMANYHGTWDYPCGDTEYELYGKDECTNYSGNAPWYTATYTTGSIFNQRKYNVRDVITCLIVDEGVTTLGAAAFWNLTKLKSVSLPESLVEVGYEAFRKCSSLDSIHLGPNVCTIRDRWATDCTALSVIEIDEDNKCFYVDAYGAVYDSETTTLIKVPQALNINELTIPEGVTKFATDALYENKYMVSLVLPSTMTKVEYGSLDAMTSLKYIYFNSINAPIFEKTIGAGTDAEHLVIYIPCVPTDTYDEREAEYGTQTGIATNRIESFLNEYTVQALSENAKKGSAGVTTRMTCENTTTTIQAYPSEGYNFLYWESDKSSTKITENPYSFECTEDITFTAYFSSNSYEIVVKAEDENIATTSGSGTYEIETEVEISATATKDCYTFEKWDDGNTENPRTITVGAASETFTAIFSKNALTANTSSNDETLGSVNILANRTALSGNTVYCGDTLKLTATPAEHCHFLYWNDKELAISFDTIVEDNVNFKAFFAKDSFLITFKDYDETVLQSKKYAYGETPACDEPSRKATAEYTYTFKGWTPSIENVSGEATYVAEYDSTANPYNFITVVDGKETSSTSYDFSSEVVAPANPDEKTGYTFQYWMDKDSVEVTFPFTMPATDTVVYANYKVNTYALTVYDMDKTTILADTTINYGAKVVMPTVPSHVGYQFKSWSELLSTMPAEDKVIYALFDTLSFNVTFTNRANQVIETNTYKFGASVDAIADPTEEGYTFQYWKDEAGNKVVFPFNMQAADTTILSEWTINSHNVVYVKNNGDKNDTIVYDYNKSVASPATPVKEGYTFTNWTDADNNEQAFPFNMPDKEVVLNANYSINSYDFIADVDGVKTTTSYEFGADVTMPESPVKEGYTFAGWSDSISVMPAHEVTTTAQWTINQYTITFYQEAGSTIILEQRTLDYATAITVPADPEKEGYTFDGWKLADNSNVPATMPPNDVEVFATWSINSYNYNVDIDGTVTTTQYNYGSDITLPTTPTKECYTFTSWTDSTNVMPAKDVTTKAQWSINEYQLTYYNEDKTTVIYSEKVACGAVLSTMQAPDKEGYSFAGWVDENGDAATIPGVMPGSDLTFYASYSINQYVITFNNLDGTEIQSKILDYGATITKPETDPTYLDYIFEGWSPDVPTTVPAKNMTFTAVYNQDKYNVTFYDMDKSTVVETLSLNSAAKVNAIQAPAHEGYSFVNWTDKFDKTIVFPVQLEAKDTALYAVYEINSYNLTVYNTPGDELLNKSLNYMESVSDKLTSLNPVREGYDFVEWQVMDDASASVPTTMPASDLKIVAIWTPATYNVTFVKENGEADETISYAYLSEVSAIADPTKECMTFAGWMGDADYVTFPFTMPAKNVTLNAEYTQNVHKLTIVDWNNEKLYSRDENCGETIFDNGYNVTNPTREGYTFTGWSDTVAVMPDNDLLITAQYDINTYSLGITCDENTDHVDYQYGQVITLPASPEKEGYTFLGWKKEGTSDYLQEGETMPANDFDIVCDFQINKHTVTFNDYDDATISSKEYEYGATIETPEDPTREGYTFTGWNPSVPQSVPDEDLTMTAQYSINQYVVEFQSYEGESVKTVKGDYQSAVVAPTTSTHPVLNREGYTFTGWDKDVPATIPAENVTLTAQYSINQYTVTFEDYNGDVIRTVAKDYNDTIVAPIDPTRTGYTFIGWEEDAPATIPAHDVTCVAQYAINQYEVRFYDYDSTFIKGSKGDYGADVKAPTVNHEGYTFEGWNKDVPSVLEKNDTLYAVFSVNSYDITFVDWDNSVISSTVVKYNEKIETPAEPAREGYEFTGWSADIPEIMPAYPLTFQAQYSKLSYTIAYYDYDSTLINEYTVEFEGEVPTPKNPTREGYTFSGWDSEVPETMPAHNDTLLATYTVKEYTLTYNDYDKKTVIDKSSFAYGDPVVATTIVPEREGYTFSEWTPALPDIMPSKNVTVTATYEKNKYIISFRSDDKSNIKTSNIEYGAKIVAPEIPSREGYTIIGWDKEVPETMPAHNDTLYAVYQINQYTVAYKDKFTNTTYYEETLDYGTTVDVPADPEREGYTFAGWDATLTTVPAVNITIFATWEANPYTLTYKDFDESTIQSESIACDDTITPIADPVREGYTFEGWEPEIPVVMPAKDVEVTAQYKKKTHTITFTDEEGNVIDEQTLEYGDTIVPPANPEKEGYDFEGWDPELPVTVPDEDINVKPTYTKATFILTFKDYDGTVIESDEFEFEAKIKEPKDPSRKGYTFTGWEPVVPKTMPGNDLTCVAQYEVNSYVITIVDDEDNIILEDTLNYGDTIVPPSDPEKEGYTFDGWDPVIPETMPDDDIYVKPTWTEDSLVIAEGSVKAISDKFCAGEEAGVEFTTTSGKARTFEITFSKAAIEAGFKKSVTGDVDEDGNVYFTIPTSIEEGDYKATLQLFGETTESASVEFTFSVNPNSRYLSRMWDDVVVCDNSELEFVEYQWYKDGEKIDGATNQFYCELGGLEGYYSVEVTTVDGEKKFICGTTFDRALPPFSITAYPNPATANEEFTLEVKGLTDEELEVAKIYVYTVSGTIANTVRKIDYKNLVSLPQGEYIALVVLDGKSAFCKVIVR